MRIYVDGGVFSHQIRGGRRGRICVVVSDSKPIVIDIGNVTNNQAEYLALLQALRLAIERGYQNVQILSDSELLVRQLTGEYRVRSTGLLPLYRQVRSFLDKRPDFSIKWIPRDENIAGKVLESRLDEH